MVKHCPLITQRCRPPVILTSFPDHRPSLYIRRDEKLSESWFHELPVLTQRNSGPVSTSLCSACDRLDLPGIVARMRLDPKMKTIALPPWTNSTKLPMNNGACALCALFSANWVRGRNINIEWMGCKYSVTHNIPPWSPAAVVFYNPGSDKEAVFEMIMILGRTLTGLKKNQTKISRIVLCFRRTFPIGKHVYSL